MTTHSIKSLSVVLPALNEETNIEKTTMAVLSWLDPHDFVSEIIVVNDGSRDDTQNTVEKLQKKYEKIRLINHQRNYGYGETLRSGFQAAKMDWILLMDSDGQYDIRHLDTLLPYTLQYDVLLGYRRNRADPFSRVFWTWVHNTLANLLIGVGLKDVGCGFKLFRRISWEKAQPILSRDHKIFVVEWLRNVKRTHFRILHVPITHYPRTGGMNTGASISVALGTLKALMELFFQR